MLTATDEAGAQYGTELGLKAEGVDIERLRGMKETQVVADVDVAAFVARARELDTRMVPVWGPLYQQILDTQR